MNAILATRREPGEAVSALAMNQLRLLNGIAYAYGRGRVALHPAVAIVARRLSRLGDRLPASRLTRGAVAYAGTRALGEVARRLLASTET